VYTCINICNIEWFLTCELYIFSPSTCYIFMYYNINYILPLTDGESLYRHCACCSILFVYLYYIYLYMNKILFKSNQYMQFQLWYYKNLMIAEHFDVQHVYTLLMSIEWNSLKQLSPLYFKCKKNIQLTDLLLYNRYSTTRFKDRLLIV
jgi:hypothetical protein